MTTPSPLAHLMSPHVPFTPESEVPDAALGLVDNATVQPDGGMSAQPPPSAPCSCGKPATHLDALHDERTNHAAVYGPTSPLREAAPAEPIWVTRTEQSVAPSGFTYPASTVVESDALSAYIYDDDWVDVGGARVRRPEFRAWLNACTAQMDEQDAALIVEAVERAR